MDWEKVVQIFVLFFLICLYVSTMLKCILLGKKKSLIVVLFYIFYRSSTY